MLTNTFVQICIHLVVGGFETETSIVKLPANAPISSCAGGVLGGGLRHVIIERSDDLIVWEIFAEDDFKEFSTIRILDNNKRKRGYYRIK